MFNQSVSCSITCLIYKVSQNGKKSSHNPQNIQFNVTEEEINHKNIHIKEAEIREFRLLPTVNGQAFLLEANY